MADQNTPYQPVTNLTLPLAMRTSKQIHHSNELAAKKLLRADKGTTVVGHTCIFQTNRNSSKKSFY